MTVAYTKTHTKIWIKKNSLLVLRLFMLTTVISEIYTTNMTIFLEKNISRDGAFKPFSFFIDLYTYLLFGPNCNPEIPTAQNNQHFESQRKTSDTYLLPSEIS